MDGSHGRELLEGLDASALAASWAAWWAEVMDLRYNGSAFNPSESGIADRNLQNVVERLSKEAMSSFFTARRVWISSQRKAAAGDLNVVARQAAKKLGSPVEQLRASVYVVLAETPWHLRTGPGRLWCSAQYFTDPETLFQLIGETFVAGT